MSRYPGRYPTGGGESDGGSGGGDGGGWETTTVTSDYPAGAGEEVLVDASGGAVDVTLPAASEGARVRVKKVDATDAAVGVVTPGDATVDGATALSISGEGIARELSSDGSDYHIV